MAQRFVARRIAAAARYRPVGVDENVLSAAPRWPAVDRAGVARAR